EDREEFVLPALLVLELRVEPAVLGLGLGQPLPRLHEILNEAARTEIGDHEPKEGLDRRGMYRDLYRLRSRAGALYQDCGAAARALGDLAHGVGQTKRILPGQVVPPVGARHLV